MKKYLYLLVFCYYFVGVDVGAAPGAWTEFLSPKIKKVIAIDPAELDPKVVSLPNVIHIKKKVFMVKRRIFLTLQFSSFT